MIDLLMGEAAPIIGSSAVTGLISAVVTVSRLKVHVEYLSKGVDETKQSVTNAHKRIDALSKSNVDGGVSV